MLSVIFGSGPLSIRAELAEIRRIGAACSKIDMAVAGNSASRMTQKLTLDVPSLTQGTSAQPRWASDVGMARPGLGMPDFTGCLAPPILVEACQIACAIVRVPIAVATPAEGLRS